MALTYCTLCTYVADSCIVNGCTYIQYILYSTRKLSVIYECYVLEQCPYIPVSILRNRNEGDADARDADAGSQQCCVTSLSPSLLAN